MVEPYDEGTEFQFNQEPEEGEVVYEEGEKAPKYEEAAKSEVPSKQEKGTGAGKRVFILLLVLVVVAFVGYKVVNLFSGAKMITTRPTAVIPAITTKPSAEQINSLNKIKIEPVAAESVPAAPGLTPKQEDVLIQKIADQNREVTQLLSQVDALHQENAKFVKDWQSYTGAHQEKIQAVEQSLNDLKNNLKNLQLTVDNLNNQLKKNESIARLHNIQQKRAAEKHAKIVREQRQLFVEAVIPGRAWLRSVDGSTRTVVIGDVIEGYGTVVSINSYSGTVVTNTGRKIYYGVNN